MSAELIQALLALSLAFIMFTLGLGLKISDFTNIARYPKAFLTGIVNQMILLPIIGFLIAKVFGLSPMLAVGFVLLALSPGGVTTNVVTRMANGNTALSISLTAVVTLVSVVTLPILLGLSMSHFLGEAAPEFSIVKTAITMFVITVVPVALGMFVSAVLPGLVAAVERGLYMVAVILFFLIIGAALVSNWDLFAGNFATVGPALILLLIATLALGLWTGRMMDLSERDRTTIAIETGVQNGTLAITVSALVVGTAADGGFSAMAVPAALYGIIMYLSVLFALYRKSTHPA